MRYFLLIPAMLLFLSNIPFIHKMDVKEMMAAMEEKGCCKKKQASNEGECKMEDMQPPAEPALQHGPSCHAERNATPPTEKACDDDAGKCEKPDATCVCVCCFQYAAPDQFTAKMQFGLGDNKYSLSGFIQNNWKDPHLTAPWQPPDSMLG